MSFVQANAFQNANRGVDDIERIVVHTAEIDEGPLSAERIAGFFAAGSTEVSAHGVIDTNSVVQCVREEDIAFHAKGDNSETIGYELAARANQTTAQWRDAASTAMLERFARYIAPRCVKYDIPPRWLTAAQERERVRGFVSHKIVSDVFGEGIRSDPGANFPYDGFMRMVKDEIAALNPPPPATRLPEWRVVIDNRIAHREKHAPGQRPTAYDLTLAWMGAEGEQAVKEAASSGLPVELVSKPGSTT